MSSPSIASLAIPLPALPSLQARYGPSSLSGRRRRAYALATVRRANCTYGFPVCSFHEDTPDGDANKGQGSSGPTSRSGKVDPGSQYPRTMMYGFFAKPTDPPHRLYSSGFPSRPACLRPPPSPTHFRRPARRDHAVLAAFQVLFSGPTTDRASLPTSLPLIGLLTRVFPRPCQSSWGHTLFFRPVPSANTLVRWVNENAFASIVQARPDPPWADRFIIGVAPIDYGPGLLLRPFGFHLAMDTLPSGVLPRKILSSLRPARNYPRFWIWRPSSGRQRDFNPPEQRAAQHTLWALYLLPTSLLGVDTQRLLHSWAGLPDSRL